MSGSFQVVYDDLGTTASAFESESTQFLGVTGRLGVTAADTGDPALTALVERLLETGRFLADVMRNATFAHAAKLNTCAQSYQATDAHATALFQALQQP